MTDGRPEDTSWELSSCHGLVNTTVASSPPHETYHFKNSNYSAHTLYEHQVCVPAGARHVFAIRDWRHPKSDGICCDEGEGYYKVFLDGTLAVEGGDFEEEEVTAFGGDACGSCPPGERSVGIDFKTNAFPHRVTWKIQEAACNEGGGQRVLARNPEDYEAHTLYRHNACIPDDPAKEFRFSVSCKKCVETSASFVTHGWSDVNRSGQFKDHRFFRGVGYKVRKERGSPPPLPAVRLAPPVLTLRLSTCLPGVVGRCEDQGRRRPRLRRRRHLRGQMPRERQQVLPRRLPLRDRLPRFLPTRISQLATRSRQLVSRGDVLPPAQRCPLSERYIFDL